VSDPRVYVSELDRRLDQAVMPADYRNPTPAPRYDLVVLGGGTAGLVAAAGASGLGARVALVERHRMGGDCLNYGCVPSKAILATAERAARIADAAALAISVERLEVDFPAAMERLRARRTEIARHDSVARFGELGVDVFLGDGAFVAGDRIRVHPSAGADRDIELSFRRAVIATGGRAVVPSIPGLAESGYLTNETIFDLTERPRRLAVLGAGPIGCELAQAFARLGSEVVLIANQDRVLPREEADAAMLVQARLERDGVDLRRRTSLTAVTRAEGRLRLTLEQQRDESGGGAGRDREISELAADHILLAVGRQPNLERLGLEAAGVETRDGRLVVDDHLRTTNRTIYASGDADARLLFTHAADAMSRMVIQNALFPGPKKRISSLVVPRATYTDPEIAAIGVVGDAVGELERAGRKIRTVTVRFDQVDRAILQEAHEGFARLHADAKKGTILGATIVGEGAGDLIGEVAVAMAGGVTLGRLAAVIHPYPTRAEILKKAGDAWNRERLTPGVKRLFAAWFRLTGVGRDRSTGT
jgi:pyruvate/2-oxoglutarate dehydrogenase complex dihydrolipoamide dehydrogenase (E3) component